MRRLPHAVLLCASALLTHAALAAQDISVSARQADFQAFIQDFENNYAYLDRSDKPWLTWATRYAPAVEQAGTKQAFAAVLASALSELHDFHAEVRSRVDNRWLPVPTFDDLWAEPTAHGAIVTAVREGSDAQRAGILPGDEVVRIGNIAVQAAMSDRLHADATHTEISAQRWALLSVLTGRAEEARTFTLKRQGGTVYTVTLPVERQFTRSAGALSAELLPENVGHIRFNNSLGDQTTIAAFDKALLQLRGTAGLILDLRDTPSGGDTSVALGIMGRFTTKLLAYQRHRIPNYGQPDVERNWVEFVAPRGPFPYTAPGVVLVDHWTGSMGEGMAIGFDAMRRAAVVGTPMAHLAGAVTDDKLPQTGIDVAYATEQIYHNNGTPRQDWLPPVLVNAPAAPGDALLSSALAELAKRATAQPADDLSLPPRATARPPS